MPDEKVKEEKKAEQDSTMIRAEGQNQGDRGIGFAGAGSGGTDR